MILFAIISLFLGFSVVAFSYIVESKAGLLIAALSVAVYALWAGTRMAVGRASVATLIVGGICGVAPIWLIPAYQGADSFRHFLPVVIATSVCLLAGLAFSYWQEMKKGGRKPRPARR